MRIAYIINSVEGGGASSPVPAITRVLRDGGAEVAVFALRRRDGRGLAAMEAAGLEVRVRDGGGKDQVAALRWLDAQVAEWRPTHLWTSLTRATLLGQIVGERRQLPVVSWQHNAFRRFGNYSLLKWRQRKSALWIADSEAIRRLVHDQLGVEDARLVLWPIYRPDPAARRAAPWHPGERLRIGSLGRLHSNKGYDVLADALDRLAARGIAAEVTIGGEGEQRAVLERQRSLRLQGFVGDPASFLSGLHLYIQPSRTEGFCIAAHEAMLAGLPVIASAVGEMAYSVLPGETGWLVPQGDPSALAEALVQAIAAPKRLATMGAAGRDRLLERFGPEQFDRAGREILQRIRAIG